MYDPSLTELIRQKTREGKTAIQIQKELREEGYGISWIETQAIFNKVTGG